MKKLELSFSLTDSEYLTALRLVAGCVCSSADIDIDTLEDFKVCVTESALILKNGGFKKLSACFETENGVKCVLSGENGTPEQGDNELSLALISALVGECDINNRDGIIDRITLKI